MNRLGLKLSCLVVAIVIWIQVASTATVEQVARLPLRVTGLAEGQTIVGSALPTEVSVRLRGSKLRLLAHRYLQQPVGTVTLDLTEREPGRAFTVVLGPGDVASELTVTQVVEPDRLTVRIDGQLSRRLPVELTTIGSLASGYGYLTAPAARPDSIRVTGPARYFPDRPLVRTAPLDLARLEGAGELSLPLLLPDSHLVLDMPEVKVAYSVGRLAERTLADVPVRAIADDGTEVGLSPAQVDVMVRGVADSLLALSPARLRVTVAAKGLASGMHMLPGDVQAPDWVTVIGLDPAQFQVVVGAAAPVTADGSRARE